MPRTSVTTLIPPVKTGVKTSEFWLTVVTSTLALLAAFGVIGPNWAHMHEQAVQAMAFLVGTGAPGAYALSRGVTKRAHQNAIASLVVKAVMPETVAVHPVQGVAPTPPVTTGIVVDDLAPVAPVPTPPSGDTPSL